VGKWQRAAGKNGMVIDDNGNKEEEAVPCILVVVPRVYPYKFN
jgi:hypothetical protein